MRSFSEKRSFYPFKRVLSVASVLTITVKDREELKLREEAEHF